MGQGLRDEIQSRRYYIPKNYRRIVFALNVSLILSLGLIALISLIYLAWPPQRYFASNAEYSGSIIELKPMSHPNERPDPLLPPDMPAAIEMKDIDLPAETTDNTATVTPTTTTSPTDGSVVPAETTAATPVSTPSPASTQAVPAPVESSVSAGVSAPTSVSQ